MIFLRDESRNFQLRGSSPIDLKTGGVGGGGVVKQEGHDGPVSLHWLIREIHSYQTLHYLGIGLKHKTPYKD